MPSMAAITTGMYSALQPAITAFTAIASTVAWPLRGGSAAIRSLALRPEAATNFFTASAVAGMIGSPSVQPCSYAYSYPRVRSSAIESPSSLTSACIARFLYTGTEERGTPCGLSCLTRCAVRFSISAGGNVRPSTTL